MLQPMSFSSSTICGHLDSVITICRSTPDLRRNRDSSKRWVETPPTSIDDRH